MAIRVLIAGGGTSGHINPALAIAEEIKLLDGDSVVEFCGTRRGLESDIIPRAGYVLHPIRAAGIPSKPSPKMLRALLDFKAGRQTSIELIRTFKPDVIIGTGGYVCAPLVSAAYHENIPVLLHEQNAFPGRSNRYMSKKAQVVCTGFPDLEGQFPKAKSVVFTGNPVRSVFFNTNRKDARKVLNLSDDTLFILAIGGSLGARTLNQSVLSLDIKSLGPKVKVALSAGKQQYKDLIAAQQQRLAADSEAFDGEHQLEIVEYIYDPHIYMAAADLVICRAGAVTCSEVAALGLPSIMIPYPYAAGDHQTYNAQVFSNLHATTMINDQFLSAQTLQEAILKIVTDTDKKQKMGQQAKLISKPFAVQEITAKIFELVEKRHNH